MTIQELYTRIDGSYESVLRRIPSEELIIRFAKMFMGDTSYQELMAAVEIGDIRGGFEASHKLKGLAANMGFTGLYNAASDLTEFLRPGPETIDLELVDKVSKNYNIVTKGIKEFDDEIDKDEK